MLNILLEIIIQIFHDNHFFFVFIGFGLYYIGLSASYCFLRKECVRVCVMRGLTNFLLVLTFFIFFFHFRFFLRPRFLAILYRLSCPILFHVLDPGLIQPPVFSVATEIF